MGKSRRLGRRPARLLAALALVGGTGLTGCGTGALSNKSVSVCYRAIPVGRNALHGARATMIGVHRVPVDQVLAYLTPSDVSSLGADNDTELCVMTFKGTFAAGQVELAPGTERGDYALVLVTTKKLKLIASAVIDHAPRGFGGRTV